MKETVRQSAGAALRRLRTAAGLSQAEVARRVYGEVAYRAVVARTERGKHTPSLALCNAQATACGGSLLHVLHAVDVALGLATAPTEAT